MLADLLSVENLDLKTLGDSFEVSGGFGAFNANNEYQYGITTKSVSEAKKVTFLISKYELTNI